MMQGSSQGGVRRVVRIHPWLVGRRGFFDKKSTSSRDVFVFDNRFRLQEWLGAHTEPKNPYPLRHPVHGHILSAYAKCEYSRPFNYNYIGEYSLNIAAGEKYPSTTLEAPAGTHDVIIWPDNISINRLATQDVSVLYSLLLNEKALDISELSNKLSKTATVSTLSKKIRVIVNASPRYPLFRAENVLGWFANSLREANLEDDVELILGTCLTEHRKSTQILVLPSENTYDGILSAKQVKSIVDSFSLIAKE